MLELVYVKMCCEPHETNQPKGVCLISLFLLVRGSPLGCNMGWIM